MIPGGTAPISYNLLNVNENYNLEYKGGSRAIILEPDGNELLPLTRAECVYYGNERSVKDYLSEIFPGMSTALIGSIDSVIPDNYEHSTLIASKNVVSPGSYIVSGGFSENGPASMSNIKWSINSATGIGNFRSVTTASGSADYAEMFENGTGKELAPGTLVKLVGSKVFKASNKDIFGVVSYTYAVLGNLDNDGWHNKYLTDDFGRVLTKDVKLKNGEIIKEPILNPSFDPNEKHVNRLDKPDEWTPVGLMGQLLVRTDATVTKSNVYLRAVNGIGSLSVVKTNVRVMQITKEYDPKLGYGVAKCYVQGGIL